jgi:hypothetical protein
VSSSLRRGALAATALVFPLATLAACGAGNNAQTKEVKPDSAATSVGVIKIQNIALVTQPKPGAEGPAAVTGKVFNTGTKRQTLDSITLPGTTATVDLSPAKGSGPLVVPAGGSVQLGGKGNASAVIGNGLPASKNGNAEQVVFTLSETGEVGVRALVVPATSYFGQVGATSTPTPSDTATPSGSSSDSASSGSGSSDSGSPSDSPSGSASDDTGTGGGSAIG